MQKVTAIGNLGRDVEMRYTQQGAAVASFSIAVSEKWKDKATGEQKESTEWLNCVVFGKQAEVAEKFLSKGSKIYIEGKLKTSQYDKEGQTHYKTDINVREFEFLSPKNESQGQSNSQGIPPQQQREHKDDMEDD